MYLEQANPLMCSFVGVWQPTVCREFIHTVLVAHVTDTVLQVLP